MTGCAWIRPLSVAIVALWWISPPTFGQDRSTEPTKESEDPTAEIAGPLSRLQEDAYEPVASPPRKAWGVRLGALIMGEPGWETGLRAGVYYRKDSPDDAVLEIGADVSSVERTNGDVASTLASLRADATFAFPRSPPRRRGYLLAGLEATVESAENSSTGDQSIGVALGLDLALGLADDAGRWDVRIQHTLLVGSEEVASQWLIAVAVGF